MGMFSGISNARARFDQNYAKQGHYLVRIDRVKADQNWKRQDYVAVEMTVLHVYEDGQGDPTQWHKVGENISDVMSSGSATNADVEEVGEQEAEVVCSESQPLAGLVMEIVNREIMTKQNQKLIVTVAYRGLATAAELGTVLAPEVIEQHFPGEALQQLAARLQSFGVN